MDPNSASGETMCDSCGVRPAVNFISNGSTGEPSDLCDQCVAVEAPAAAALTKEARSAKCEYCGGWPCGGGLDFLARLKGETAKIRWKCMSCMLEFNAFCSDEFERISKGLTDVEQLAEMKKVSAAVDAHMREFVKRRDG